MNLLRRIILSILASLSLLALPATARTQVTSGENINQATDAPSQLTPPRCRKKPLKSKSGLTPIRTTATN